MSLTLTLRYEDRETQLTVSPEESWPSFFDQVLASFDLEPSPRWRVASANLGKEIISLRNLTSGDILTLNMAARGGSSRATASRAAPPRSPSPQPPPPPPEDDVPPPPPPEDPSAIPSAKKPPTPAKPLPPPPKAKSTPSVPAPQSPALHAPTPQVATPVLNTPEASPTPARAASPLFPAGIPSSPSVSPHSPATESSLPKSHSTPAAAAPPGGSGGSGGAFPGIRLREAPPPKVERSGSGGGLLGKWQSSLSTFGNRIKEEAAVATSAVASLAPIPAGGSPSPTPASPTPTKPLPVYEPPARTVSKNTKIGKLRMIVTEARNLSTRGKDAPDPYCVIGPVDLIGNIIPEKAVKTETIKSCARPTWSATFNFATKEDFKGLLLECWDEGGGKKKRFLGQVDFPPQILIDGRDITTWFSLGKKPTDKSKQADVKGDIYISLLYTEGGVVEEAPPPEEKKKKTDLKRMDAIDQIITDLKGSNPQEALKALVAYITTTSIYSEGDTEILDPEFAANAIKKDVVDAVLHAVQSSSNSDVITLSCFVFGKLAELDSETVILLSIKGVASTCLKKLKSLGTSFDMAKGLAVFAIAKSAEAKQQMLEGDAPALLLTLLKHDSKNAATVMAVVKGFNALASEATDAVKKELAAKVLNDNVSEFLALLSTFEDNEDLVEATLSFIDQLFEFVNPISAVGNSGIDSILRVMQKYRLGVQVHGAAILARLVEDADYAKHTADSGAIPIFVKMLGTEYFLRHFEQRSRELSLKCLNKVATTDANIAAMRDAGIVKPLDAAMRTYATMIVQLQGVLLIKAMAKDEVIRQQLVQIGIGQLLTSAASKHPTLTRLHKMVDDLKQTYGWS